MRPLRPLIVKAGAATLALLGAISAAVEIRTAVTLEVILIVSFAFLALIGWALAWYVSFSIRQESPVERLIGHITATVDFIPFVETTLRATLLSQRAVDAYWHCNDSLKIDSISCVSRISGSDVANVMSFDGFNDSRLPVHSCPMLLHGGAVKHFAGFLENFAEMETPLGSQRIQLRSVLDFGHLHFVEMMFPIPLDRGERFVVRQHHTWPGAMVAGLDVMWYPYVAMFKKDVNCLVIDLEFEERIIMIRGYSARRKSGECVLSQRQPERIAHQENSFQWTIDEPDNDAIYFAIFDRE